VTPTILCLSSYYKGNPFLQEAKALGAHVILVTIEELKDEPWARDAIDELFYLPVTGLSVQPNTTHAVSYLARTRRIDRIVALDDFDVETAADLREHLRLPGLSASEARYFRDKLAMRVQAMAKGVPIPHFVHTLNDDQIREYLATVPGPWVLKPRSEASSMGIKKIENGDELWPRLEELGDRRSFYLLEKFIAGDVYHVDSMVWDGNVVFVSSSRYGMPPMTVYQGGGVFATSTIEAESAEDQALESINREVIHAMGLRHGVTHAEFIRGSDDGRFYFLEMAARVGGAGIDQMVEQATGVNPWREWAHVEVALARGEEYTPPVARREYAGLIVSLARQEWPDTSAYTDHEVVWRLNKKHHVGLIVRSPSHARVQELMGQYANRIAVDFSASQPPLEHAPH
jgi:biotin carboxylase